ncbi:MAG TPA: hypothetical protein VJ691_08780 [Vicinamibacterales bacterium]|nr:hypothetical protein [Vicinamibacterales bacterium]
MAKKKNSGAHPSTQTYWLAAVGLVFVLGAFAMLLRESFTGGQRVADIRIRVDEILPSADGYLVSVKIENSGDATAAALNVEGVLMRGGTQVESSLVTVDYVAAGSERDAALLFSNDPRQGELTVRAKGYIEP